MRVLIVEDDPSLRRQLCDRLTAEGYAIDTAADGEEAAFKAKPSPMTPSFSTSDCPGRTG